MQNSPKKILLLEDDEILAQTLMQILAVRLTVIIFFQVSGQGKIKMN